MNDNAVTLDAGEPQNSREALYQQTIKDLRERNAEIVKAADALEKRSQNAALHATIQRLQDRSVEINQEREDAQEALKDLRERNAELEARYKELNEALRIASNDASHYAIQHSLREHERDRALSELAEARKDTERLDWLGSRSFTAYVGRDPENGKLYWPVVVDEDAPGSRKGNVEYTLREAIDAARTAADPKEQHG